MPTEKILFVDDEPNLLQGIKRQFRTEFAITTAPGGEEGLQAIASDGPFDVIVSDLRMPGMNGIEFLTKAQETSPDSVRMMLTGNADVSTAMQAVNEGRIFRFLSKPCAHDVLGNALRAALEQCHLMRAERELLDKTLHGSVKLLTDLLGLVNPTAFGRASRVKRYVKRLLVLASEREDLSPDDLWQAEMAAMLSQIGCVALPENLLKKVNERAPLTEEEQKAYLSHPSVGRDLITNIPRLEGVAEIVALQDQCFDGSNAPEGTVTGANIPLAARILKIVLDFDTLVSAGATSAAAIAAMQDHASWYDPSILQALESLVGLESEFKLVKVMVRDAAPSMILAEDIFTMDGQLLIAKGFELNPSIVQRLEYFVRNGQLKEPICVLIPVRREAPAPELAAV